jgi:hypothetical protein
MSVYAFTRNSSKEYTNRLKYQGKVVAVPYDGQAENGAKSIP